MTATDTVSRDLADALRELVEALEKVPKDTTVEDFRRHLSVIRARREVQRWDLGL